LTIEALFDIAASIQEKGGITLEQKK